MPKVQNEMKRDFTVVHNAFLRDEKLGITERGLLITMLCKPDNYNFTIRGLAYELTDGVTKISNALNKLEKLGYLKRQRIIEKGKFADMLYRFSDEPIFREDTDCEDTDTADTAVPDTENQHTDFEDSEKPYDLINTYKINTDKVNTDKTNTAPSAENATDAEPKKPVSQKYKANKKDYAEAVKMTDEEYQKLTDKHTKAFVDKCIEVLNNYKLSSGKTYKSDYHAILTWVEIRVANDYPQLDRVSMPATSTENPVDDIDVNPFDQFV